MEDRRRVEAGLLKKTTAFISSDENTRLQSRTLVMAHHKHSESDVERSGTTSNGSIVLEDLVCFWSTETFRPWSNYGGSFAQQLSSHRGVPSRLATALHHSGGPRHVLESEVVRSETIEDNSFAI